MTQNTPPTALSLEVQEIESRVRASAVTHTTARTCTCAVLAVPKDRAK